MSGVGDDVLISVSVSSSSAVRKIRGGIFADPFFNQWYVQTSLSNIARERYYFALSVVIHIAFMFIKSDSIRAFCGQLRNIGCIQI